MILVIECDSDTAAEAFAGFCDEHGSARVLVAGSSRYTAACGLLPLLTPAQLHLIELHDLRRAKLAASNRPVPVEDPKVTGTNIVLSVRN